MAKCRELIFPPGPLLNNLGPNYYISFARTTEEAFVSHPFLALMSCTSFAEKWFAFAQGSNNLELNSV